ncbi:MAG: hypothetical protein ACI9T7_003337 [Oleiphilaceae bacterium]
MAALNFESKGDSTWPSSAMFGLTDLNLRGSEETSHDFSVVSFLGGCGLVATSAVMINTAIIKIRTGSSHLCFWLSVLKLLVIIMSALFRLMKVMVLSCFGQFAQISRKARYRGD